MSLRRNRVILMLSLVPTICMAAPPPPNAGTRALLSANPGLRATIQDGRLVALYGRSFADRDQEPTTRAFVDGFLANNADALGADGAQFQFRYEIALRGDKFKVVAYTQTIDGLEVHGSVVKVRVLQAAGADPDKIVYVGMRLFQPPDPPLPSQNEISDAAAIAVATAAHGHLTYPDPLDLNYANRVMKVVYLAPDDTLHRVWRFPGWDTDELWRFFVDTTSSQIVGIEDAIHRSGVQGKVKGWRTDGINADWSLEQEETELEGVEVRLVHDDDNTCAYEDPADEEQFTIPSVGYNFPNGTTNHWVAANLTGQWVTVWNCGGVVCVDGAGVATGQEEKPIECLDVTYLSPLAQPPLEFNEPTPESELDSAAVNAFLVGEETHDWFKGLFEASEEFDLIDFVLPIFVNNGPACFGSYKNIATSEHVIQMGSTHEESDYPCTNFAFSKSMISHEYGHFITSQVVGPFIPAGNPFFEAMSQTIASLKWDTSCIAENYMQRPPGVLLPCQYNVECSTSPIDVFCPVPCDQARGVCANEKLGVVSTNDSYGVANVIAGAFWDLSKKLRCCSTDPDEPCTTSVTCEQDEDCDEQGGEKCFDRPTEELFADFMTISIGEYDESILIDVLVADDDNGDLSDGTPNCSEILCAFVGEPANNDGERCQPLGDFPGCQVELDCEVDVSAPLEPLLGHGFECPNLTGVSDGSVKVTWLGPITQLEPIEGTDYEVHYETNLPTVILKTTKVGSLPQPVEPVTDWFVSRYFDGKCDGGANPEKLCNGNEDCLPSGTCAPFNACFLGDDRGESCTPPGNCAQTAPCLPYFQALDLGTVTANWTVDTARDITVEIGREAGEACRGVQIVDIPTESSALSPPDETTWSDVQLKLTRDLSLCFTVVSSPCTPGDCPPDQICWAGACFQTCAWNSECPGGNCLDEQLLSFGGNLSGRAQCYADQNAQGGRISGEVQGIAARVYGGSIGDAAQAEPGFKAVELTLAKIDQLPSGHKIIADFVRSGPGLSGGITINGPLDGRIEVAGNLEGAVKVYGDGGANSAILADGNLEGAGSPLSDPVAVYIDGDMDGDIHADHDEDGTGAIVGKVTVTGLFRGDICGANLRADSPNPTIPDHIDITFDAGGAICGRPVVCSTNADCDDADPCSSGECEAFRCSYTVVLSDGSDCGTGNVCCAGTCISETLPGDPLLAAYPHDRRKNRYISFDPNKATNDCMNTAFKVELKSINQGSCDDGTGAQGGNVDFCRTDRGPADCKACSGLGDSCISASIDCPPGESCDPTGAVCVNDLPNSGGSNVDLVTGVWWVGEEKLLEDGTPTGVHLLVSEAFRWASTNWPNPTHVSGCEIVPQARYGVRAVKVATGFESDELVVLTTALNVCSVSGDLCNVDDDCPAGETCNPIGPPAPFWWGDVVGGLGRHCNGDIRQQTCDPNTSNGDCTGPATPASCCTGVGTGLCDCPGADPCVRAWELPNGVTNLDDVTAALWASAPAPPTTVSADFTWVDVHGNDSFTPGSQNFDPPNNKINASDLQQIISAFGGLPYKFYDPKDCPNVEEWPRGSGELPDPGDPVFTLVPSDDLLDPTEDLVIDVFVSAATNVAGHELALEVTGGTAGALTVTDISVDTNRTDYLYYDASQAPLEMKQLPEKRLGAVVQTLGEGMTKTGPAYLATYTFQPTGGATGVFEVNVRGQGKSFLLSPNGSTQVTDTSGTAVVGFGVDCLIDGHCDDNQECTTDTCSGNYECQYAPVTAGTACDDGLWCTRAGSTCDGNGLCTGGNPRCQPGELCIESTQTCAPDLPPLP